MLVQLPVSVPKRSIVPVCVIVIGLLPGVGVAPKSPTDVFDSCHAT